MSEVSEEERRRHAEHAHEVRRRRSVNRQQAGEWCRAAVGTDPYDGQAHGDAAADLNAAAALLRVAGDDMHIGDDPRQLLNVETALGTVLSWVDEVIGRYVSELDQMAAARALCDPGNPAPVERGVEVVAGLAARHRAVLEGRRRTAATLGPAAFGVDEVLPLQATRGGGSLCGECGMALARHDLDQACAWVWPRRWDAKRIRNGQPDLPAGYGSDSPLPANYS